MHDERVAQERSATRTPKRLFYLAYTRSFTMFTFDLEGRIAPFSRIFVITKSFLLPFKARSIKVSADFSKQSFRHWKRKRSIIVANELHKISMTRSAPILLFFPFSKEIRSDPGNSTWHYTVIERVPSRSDSLFESNG